MNKLIKTLLVLVGLTFIIVVLSLSTFPQWLTIPGGLFILFGLAFDAVLGAGSKIKNWIDLLSSKEKHDIAPKTQSSFSEIDQEGVSNIVAANIDHLEIHNPVTTAVTKSDMHNLTDKQKDSLISLVNLGREWSDEFYIYWHEPMGISDILDYDGNPPQISKGDIRVLEREGLLICEFLGNDKAHVTLRRKSLDAISFISKEVNLTITPQEKIISDFLYIIIGVTNNESKSVFCRIEILEICNQNGENIKSEISQYSNLFSWSGGSQNGTKEIFAGLDGTVNLVVRRTNSYGFYFLFQENPDTNWKKPGIYKLDLAIKGTIEGIDFVGKKVTITFEYIEKEERDSMGGFFNRGFLNIIDWSVEKVA